MKIKFVREDIKNRRKITDLKDGEFVWSMPQEERFLEKLYCSSIYSDKELQEEWKGEIFQPGDIVIVGKATRMGNRPTDSRTPIYDHRAYIINSIEDKKGKQYYTCYMMSSEVWQSNKEWFESHPNSTEKQIREHMGHIYINNYGTILKTGRKSLKNEVYINISDEYTFSNKDLDEEDIKVGEASDEFKRFIKLTASKYNAGVDTSNIFWEK